MPSHRRNSPVTPRPANRWWPSQIPMHTGLHTSHPDDMRASSTPRRALERSPCRRACLFVASINTCTPQPRVGLVRAWRSEQHTRMQSSLWIALCTVGHTRKCPGRTCPVSLAPPGCQARMRVSLSCYRVDIQSIHTKHVTCKWGLIVIGCTTQSRARREAQRGSSSYAHSRVDSVRADKGQVPGRFADSGIGAE